MRQATRSQPKRRPRHLVMLSETDLHRVLSLIGGVDREADIILVPFSIAQSAGWERLPDTVLSLDQRKNIPTVEDGVRIKIILDPTHPMLANPEAPDPRKTWTPLASERVNTGSVSLHNLIPGDDDDER